MMGNKENIASMQSDFFREKYRKMLRWLLFTVSLIVILIGVIIYLLLFKAPPQYFADTVEGKILPIAIKSD